MPFIEYSKIAEQSQRCQKCLKRRLEQVNKIGGRLLWKSWCDISPSHHILYLIIADVAQHEKWQALQMALLQHSSSKWRKMSPKLQDCGQCVSPKPITSQYSSYIWSSQTRLFILSKIMRMFWASLIYYNVYYNIHTVCPTMNSIMCCIMSFCKSYICYPSCFYIPKTKTNTWK